MHDYVVICIVLKCFRHRNFPATDLEVKTGLNKVNSPCERDNFSQEKLGLK